MVNATPHPTSSPSDDQTTPVDLSDEELDAASGGGAPLAGSGFDDLTVGAVIF
jgi:hypothetical protein